MAAGATYEPIATTTLSVDTSNITFSSISSSYTDLRLVFNGKSTRAGANVDTLGIQLNSDTGTNYSTTNLSADGTTASSYRTTSASRWDISYMPAALFSNSIFGLFTLDLFNYAGSTNKNGLIVLASDKNNATYSLLERIVCLWRSTSAISSIKIYSTTSSNLLAGSTATLYGIKAA